MVGGYNGKIRSPSIVEDLVRASVRSGLIGGQIYVAEVGDVGIVGAAI